MKPLYIFTHIPKTAGSSFRNEAEHYFGTEKMLCDYSSRAKITTPVVRELVHEQEDFDGFARFVRNGDFRFLSGHFKYIKYRDVFPDARYVCWVREPVAQVWSHFRHYRRHHGFEGGLEDFYVKPAFRNMQIRQIDGSPDKFSFIGVTEHYEESLNLFNQRFGLGFRVRRANRAPDGDIADPEPSNAVREKIRELNHRDVALYEMVTQRLWAQLAK